MKKIDREKLIVENFWKVCDKLNIVVERLNNKDLNSLKQANKSTYPKIPVSAIFFHDVPDISTILDTTRKAGADFSKNGLKNFKKESIDVKMIIPTQKNVNADNLKTTDTVGEDTKAELVRQGQFYFVLDGHHRIANAIIQGLDEIKAYVYHN